MADLSVAGRIYQGGRLVKGVLHIDTAAGVIEKVTKSQALKEHLDFGDKAVLPGAIDVHVHFRDPGAMHKEDFQTGTTAAAFGGVTSVVDMPNTLPPTTNPRTVQGKHEIAAKKAVVDYGFWAGATWYADGLPETLKGCVGVKAYLGATTGDLLLDDPTALRKVFERAAEAGKPIALHAEAERILKGLKRTEHAPADHDAARPPLAEVEAVYDVMKLIAPLKRTPRIHVAHMASQEAVHAAEQARFSRGVCPHHLLLSTQDFADVPDPGFGKMNPPLRDERGRKALYSAFAAGRIQVLESDHAPHTRAEKEGQFQQAPAGVPGVETLMPVMLAEAAAGRLDLRTVVDAASSAPAALLGLEDRGALETGRRADFAVYDLDDVGSVDPDRLHSKCGWSPFAGRDAVFPSQVFLAGRPVVEDGGLVAGPGTGRSLVPWP